MARTVPDIEAGATQVRASWTYVDKSGDQRSESLLCDPAVTDATLEAATEALGNATNANLYKFTKSTVWKAVKSTTPAVAQRKDSVWDQFTVLYQTPGGESQDYAMPAPVMGMFVGETDNPDVASSIFSTARNALEACLNNAYEPVQVRFVERKEINKAVPAE